MVMHHVSLGKQLIPWIPFLLISYRTRSVSYMQCVFKVSGFYIYPKSSVEISWPIEGMALSINICRNICILVFFRMHQQLLCRAGQNGRFHSAIADEVCQRYPVADDDPLETCSCWEGSSSSCGQLKPYYYLYIGQGWPGVIKNTWIIVIINLLQTEQIWQYHLLRWSATYTTIANALDLEIRQKKCVRSLITEASFLQCVTKRDFKSRIILFRFWTLDCILYRWDPIGTLWFCHVVLLPLA